MASAGLNLALLSPAEKQAMSADRAACLLKYHREKMGKDWRAWAEAELKKMSNEAAVREALNLRLQVSK